MKLLQYTRIGTMNISRYSEQSLHLRVVVDIMFFVRDYGCGYHPARTMPGLMQARLVNVRNYAQRVGDSGEESLAITCTLMALQDNTIQTTTKRIKNEVGVWRTQMLMTKSM